MEQGDKDLNGSAVQPKEEQEVITLKIRKFIVLFGTLRHKLKLIVHGVLVGSVIKSFAKLTVTCV